jgi:hypothetical protein
MINKNLIIWNIIGGIFIIASYAIFLPKIKDQQKLWVGLSKSTRYLYMISILLSVIAYITAFSITITHDNVINNTSLYYWGLTLFFIGAFLWAPSIYYDMNKFITIMTLCITSIGILLMTLSTSNIIVMICLAYIFIHCLLLDNTIWAIRYLGVETP